MLGAVGPHDAFGVKISGPEVVIPPGAVWHCSVAQAPDSHLSPAVLRSVALSMLDGVGDAGRGEWHFMSRKAFHVRRRLSEAEDAIVGPAIDIRGTEEAIKRVREAMAASPQIPEHFFLEELRS